MSTFTRGYDKQYKCFFCNEFYDKTDILIDNSWKCPKCGEYIRISAPELNTGYTLIRKTVSELEINDLVHMPGSTGIYMVIAIEKNNKNQVYVALKNFGKPKFNAIDFVNTVDGGYFEDSWKER